jgi:hypothetical protein
MPRVVLDVSSTDDHPRLVPVISWRSEMVYLPRASFLRLEWSEAVTHKKERIDGNAFVHILAIIIVVIIVIAAVLLLAFAANNIDLNQNGSSNSNQNNNPVPTDGNTTLLPGQASALVIVTIHSKHLLLDVNYQLFQNSDLKAEGTISGHSSVIWTITLVFPQNETGLYKSVILATSNGGGFGDVSDQAIITPQNGGTYPVTLNI